MLTKTEIKSINKLNGGHFFDKASMRFFNSRLETTGLIVGDWAYFVTSERFDDSTPRKYTVQALCISTGEVNTVGDFQAYCQRSEALKRRDEIIKRLNEQLSA